MGSTGKYGEHREVRGARGSKGSTGKYGEHGEVRGARVADAVSALPFTTEFQVKPGQTGSVAGWVTTWV